MRHTKIMLMLSLCVWGVLGAIANLLAYSDGYASVEFVFSMKGAVGAPAMWRAVDNPLVIHIGFTFIWASKLVTGLLCGYSTAQLWQKRSQPAAEFQQAKTPGLIGAAISIFMLFFGFVVISGTYFELWRDVEVMGYEAHVYAFIYAGFIGLIAWFIAMPDNDG